MCHSVFTNNFRIIQYPTEHHFNKKKNAGHYQIETSNFIFENQMLCGLFCYKMIVLLEHTAMRLDGILFFVKNLKKRCFYYVMRFGSSQDLLTGKIQIHTHTDTHFDNFCSLI